ncbi:MAG: MATE family efflux transporter [Lachnospiraceae bacterium]|jgi:putative MATE family efflux protein|nr:MATE family efflux transporter [Lachnospiraceae bacterium]
MEQEFMKERKILPLVLSMSMPMVISMAVNSLYNIVDSYFVAQLSEQAMTALALVYPVQNMINAVAIGFAIGINAVVSFYLGAEEPENADRAATQGFLWNLVHGLLLTIVCIAVMPSFLGIFSKDETVVGMALAYSNRVFLFSAVITSGLVFEKVFQAVGKMKVSMFCMICGFVTNIILDPLMIFGIGFFPKMGIAGAAYATGIGQVISLMVYLLFYMVKPIPVKIKRVYLKPEKDMAAKLYGIGISATLNLALPSLLISALNGILAGFSEKYVLVLGVYYKLQTFIYLTANGIIQGIRPLMGYNYGAGEKERVREIFHTTLMLTAGVMAVGTVLSWLIPENLIGLFTSNPQTIQSGVTALHIISLGFIVSAVSVTCSGALEGLGKGMPSLYISLFRYIIIIIPAAFLFSKLLGATGTWYAFCFTEFVAAGLSYLIYRKHTMIKLNE